MKHHDAVDGPARAGVVDTLAVLGRVVVPTLAKGVLIRRPRMVARAERLGLDVRAVRCLQRLRRTHGPGPLMLAVPLRRYAVILSPEHVHRVLAGAPEPFAPGTPEKHAALVKFEPRVSLISPPPERAARRRLNDAALESDRPVHSMAAAFAAVIDRRAGALPAEADGALTWDRFIAAWYAAVREVVLGPGASEDHDLTDMLARLRGAGNWAFLHPGRPRLMRRFWKRLAAYLDRPEPHCLAARIAARPDSEAAPVDQVAHWLFAFDPAGMATFRALALLAAHPNAMDWARREIAVAGDGAAELPFVRACLLESLRLWPTTPAILRATTRDLRWGGGSMPARTQILIYAPLFHRDDERQPYAHRFAPDLWLADDRAVDWPLVPFSEGPAACPAHHLVPMLAALMIAGLLRGHDLMLTDPDRLRADGPMPGTLDPYTLSFQLRAG